MASKKQKLKFDYAALPFVPGAVTLSEIGMHASTIENIDYALVNWLKLDVKPTVLTNKGLVQTPVVWVSPERAFQIKNEKELRDERGNLKLPMITIERTGMSKDPERKGGFQAHLFSRERNGRSGRFVLARRIKQDKTRNFASSDAGRYSATTSGSIQQNFPTPQPNSKVVIQIVSIPIPVYINLEYKITIQTEYQSQMNELVTPFITRPGQINAFILDRDGHRYEAFIDSSFNQTNNVSNMGEDERKFMTEVSIRVLGYLIGDGADKDRPIVRIDENIVEYRIPRERVIAGDIDTVEDPKRDFPTDYGIFVKK
jgi:hypothetical protein